MDPQRAKKAVFVLSNYGLLKHSIEMGDGLADFAGSLLVDEDVAEALQAKRLRREDRDVVDGARPVADWHRSRQINKVTDIHTPMGGESATLVTDTDWLTHRLVADGGGRKECKREEGPCTAHEPPAGQRQAKLCETKYWED